MNKFFSENIGWKVISFFLAALLWVIVINTQNPVLPKEIEVASINIRGISEVAAKGFVLKNEQELRNLKPKVVVRGPRLEMEKLQNDPSAFEVRMDLTPYASTLANEDAGSVEKLVQLSVYNNLPNIEIQEIRPQVVSVIFEQEEVATKNIQTNITGGSNSEYTTLKPVLSTATVEIKGPQSAVEKVHRAVVDVNVDDFSEDAISYTVPIRLLDKEGNEVGDVSMSPQEIQVTLPIGKKKRVPVEPQFAGNLPEGYMLVNTHVTPKDIMIVGTPEVVDQITSILLEPIVLDNMMQSGTFNVNLILPQNITVLDKIEGKPVVTLEIQKESIYEYKIKASELIISTIGLTNGYTLEVGSGEVGLVLRGTAEALLEITGKPIEAIVDFTSLGAVTEGTYSVPITFVVPENIELITAPATLQIDIVGIEDTFNPDKPEEEEDASPDGEGGSGGSSEEDAEADTTVDERVE